MQGTDFPQGALDSLSEREFYYTKLSYNTDKLSKKSHEIKNFPINFDNHPLWL